VGLTSGQAGACPSASFFKTEKIRKSYFLAPGGLTSPVGKPTEGEASPGGTHFQASRGLAPRLVLTNLFC